MQSFLELKTTIKKGEEKKKERRKIMRNRPFNRICTAAMVHDSCVVDEKKKRGEREEDNVYACVNA